MKTITRKIVLDSNFSRAERLNVFFALCWPVIRWLIAKGNI